MAASKEYAAVRSGVDPRKGGDKDGSKGNWLKFDPGEAKDVVILVEAEDILASEQCAIWMKDGNSPVWVYTGPDDPSHDLGLNRAYKAYLPVLELVDGKPGEVAIWGISKQTHIALLDIADAGGELKGMEVRIKRTGTGLGTRYSVVPRGKRRDVSRVEEVDIISFLGPITPDGVREHITKKLGEESYDDVVAKYAGKVKTGNVSRISVSDDPSPKPKKAKRVVAEEVEDEDDDDIEDLDDLELK